MDLKNELEFSIQIKKWHIRDIKWHWGQNEKNQNWNSKRKAERKCGKDGILVYGVTASNFPELMKSMNHHFDEALLLYLIEKLKQFYIQILISKNSKQQQQKRQIK